jgi:hypothetical protein
MPGKKINLTLSMVLSLEERQALEREAERNGGTSLAAVIRKLIRDVLLSGEKAA